MGERIEIIAAAGPAEAYLTGSAGRPGVLLYSDAIGLRPRIEEMADRIASWGYVVLAPHLFYRDGRADDLAPHVDLRLPGAREAFLADGPSARVGALTSDLVAADNPAWLGALADRAGAGPIGVTGYCMGARHAVRAAGQFPEKVAAVGGFHGGRLATDDPDSPHLSIASSTAEYVFGHADQDASMPPEQQAALDDALQAAGRPHLSEMYEGALHGYSMADTSVYNEAGAERHFERLQELLARTLG